MRYTKSICQNMASAYFLSAGGGQDKSLTRNQLETDAAFRVHFREIDTPGAEEMQKPRNA